MKEEQRIKESIEDFYGFLEESTQWGFSDAHGYMKCFETKNMLWNGLAFFCASLERRESRGGHLRVDYPDLNPEFEKCSLVFLNEEKKVKVKWN